MKTTDKLLQLLRWEQGRVVSGVRLSRILGLSRTAVWKGVCRLRERGYVVESKASAGYRFVSAPDSLLPVEIQNGLETDCFGGVIHYLDRAVSTNVVAAEKAQSGAPEGTVVIADTQSHGKGRLGRSWFSPGGSNLYFSLILRPKIAPVRMPQVTLMAAVSLCESLARFSSQPVRVKWPNDLWIGSKKVGGILVEVVADMDQVKQAVLGVGINVNMPSQAFPRDLRDRATSLSREAGKTVSRVALLQVLLRSLESDYSLFVREGFSNFRDRWTRASMTPGRTVRVQMPRGEIRGLALGIAEGGGLRIQKSDGVVEEVVCGDVFIDAAHPPSAEGETPRREIL